MCRTWDVPPSSHVRNIRRGGHPPKESSCSPERVIFPGCKRYVRSGWRPGRLFRAYSAWRLSGDSPSQQPSLNRQRGHCHVPWRHSIAALQRRQRSAAGSARAPGIMPPSVEKAPDGALKEDATGAPAGARKTVFSEKPDEQQDDDDEREKFATDVHSVLLCAVDLGTTAAVASGLRGNLPRY